MFIRSITALLCLAMLASCGSSSDNDGDNPLDEGETCVQDNPLQDCGDEGDPDPDPEPDDGIPEELAENLSSFAFSEDGATISVTMFGVDSTPLSAVYTRNAALDAQVPGYIAYSVQEDPLDRFFVALGGESDDGDTRAVAVGAGGQFNKVLQGGGYARDGVFDRPEIDAGPGAGQVSYAGNYAAVTNIGAATGPQLLPVPGGVDESLRPSQPALITGTIFLNANFADDSVNGGIFDRVLINPNTGVGQYDLRSLSLIITDVDAAGEFLGDVEIDGEIGVSVGDYGGIFGGQDASGVGGIVAIELANIETRDRTVPGSVFVDDLFENPVIEKGVFVLNQCGTDGDFDALCDIVQP